jgi:hypothetical protein
VVDLDVVGARQLALERFEFVEREGAVVDVELR